MHGGDQPKADEQGKGVGAERGLFGAVDVREGGADHAQGRHGDDDSLVDRLVGREAVEGVVDA